MKRTFTTIVCCLGLAALLACPLVTMPAQAAKGGAGAVRMTAPRSSSMSAVPTQTPKAAPNSNAKSTTTGRPSKIRRRRPKRIQRSRTHRLRRIVLALCLAA